LNYVKVAEIARAACDVIKLGAVNQRPKNVYGYIVGKTPAFANLGDGYNLPPFTV
jgi:hypothetical protein